MKANSDKKKEQQRTDNSENQIRKNYDPTNDATSDATIDANSGATSDATSDAHSGANSDTKSLYCLQHYQECLQLAYRKEEHISPVPDKIFRALNLTPLDKVKVVILGQDPYPDENLACGLAFSVPTGYPVGLPFPPSLRNIFTCLKNDPYVDFTWPSHGNLRSWAYQGVLLLNTILTVGQTPLSNKGFRWEMLTDNVIKTVGDTPQHVVFILLGKHAQSKRHLIDLSKNTILTESHPAARVAVTNSHRLNVITLCRMLSGVVRMKRRNSYCFLIF
ncbi:uracil-DNA glycosylase-like [Mercenaria mercenaria]|uniref:uracil-DNA glycosylase-like n=1 Tax=Mercenaria mercenaria TaxID=6596 RepID=UPI00234E4BE9|nr:uracil-DNA glycosylase-like [Mercenaria mercenaria]